MQQVHLVQMDRVVFLGERSDRDPTLVRNTHHVVVHVSDVLYVMHFARLEFKVTAHSVKDDESQSMSKMANVIRGNPADVDARSTMLQRSECLETVCKRVVDAQQRQAPTPSATIRGKTRSC